ncbi:MBL fold metallo-hydrolase [Sabulicella rubraurantiaca]|uniref:MBL fold metallo-hydrolase n=1 Tax=Sabulicella rubraurantiaca TaxID=2811429 RepID=UPI001F16FB32|nr:MBL fold metallo-hydrolase [Sabulicella rubraurantiaca]
MLAPFGRRRFLQSSALTLGTSALTCTAMVRDAAGADVPRIEAPVVDRLVVQVVLDGAHDLFISGAQVPGIRVERTRLFAGRANRTLQSEWGLSLHLEAQAGAETRRYLLDFGYTPAALNENIDLLNVDVAALDGLILSHGHYDHMGGLAGFLQRHRARMKEDVPLYLGGEDAFCFRHIPAGNGAFAPFGMPPDRRALTEARVRPVLSEAPLVIDRHAFTTGTVPRTSLERVLPNSFVEFGTRDGAGCDPARYQDHHFTPSELSGQPQPDQHLHEHATCFHVRGRGLVLITSCGHAGIINTVRRAQQVSGVEKVYALVGGFHLAPAPADYLRRVMTELKALDIDHVFPMHCSGANFLEAAKQEMPQTLVLCTTGSRFTFGA